jgi:putative membrane protein
LLAWLLKRFHFQTIAVLTGFMIGSLNKVWPWKNRVETFIDRHGELSPLIEQNVLPHAYEGEPYLLAAIVCAVAGFALIFVIERIATVKKVV